MWLWILLVIIIALCIAWFRYWQSLDFDIVDPKQFEYDIEDAEKYQRSIKDTKEKVLVIGGGFCGIGISNSLKRHKVAFDCVEQQDKMGGNWYSGVYNHVHILSSKATTRFLDFPMPKDYPDFPSGQQMYKYFEDYIAHYGLLNQTKLNLGVKLVEPRSQDELWDVTFTDGTKSTYKAIVVCNGHHWKKRFPQYQGQSEFKGLVLHSKDYKDPNIFENKNVLVVGGGNSACDITVEACRVAKSTHLSLRRGYWFLPRTAFGKPFVEFMQPWMPTWLQRIFLGIVLQITVGKYSNYGLQEPDHKLFSLHPTINNDLLCQLKLGTINPQKDIKSFTKDSVEFLDGTVIPVDVVVFATGYDMGFPMLQDGLIKFERGIPQLVGGLFHPERKNLYIFGVTQARYGAGPLISTGAEGVAQIIKAQDKISQPIGNILLKYKIAPVIERNTAPGSLRTDVLADPHSIHSRIRAFTKLVPILVWLFGKK